MQLRKIIVLAFCFAVFTLNSFATSFKGTDTACFYNASSHCTLSSSTTQLGDLSYRPAASFDRIGNGQVKLGTFIMSTRPDLLFRGTFDLNVSFLLPSGATGAGRYDAGLLGSVLFIPFAGPIGGAAIRFDEPSAHLFSYPGGGFTLSLPNNLIAIGPGSSFNLYATIEASQTPAPEPPAILLLGGGLGLFGALRLQRFRRYQPAFSLFR